MNRVLGYARTNAGAPAPGCTITVYNAGTLDLATIYTDPLSTPKANPFLSDADAFFYFYADHGRYDVRFSGVGITTPYTWPDFVLIDFADAAFRDRSNTFVGDQTITGALVVSGGGTFGTPAVALIGADGKLAGLTAAFLASLDANALTNLNADELLSGTVPDAALSGEYTGQLTLSNPLNVLAAAQLGFGPSPAQSGSLRLSFGDIIKVRDSSDTSDLTLFEMLAGDHALLNILLESIGAIPAGDNLYDLGRTDRRWASTYLRDLHNYGFLALYGALAGGVPATAGLLRLPSSTTLLLARNAGDTDNIGLLGVNSDDQIVLGDGVADLKLAKPVVALGAGVAAALGTIGDDGPAVQTQNSWCKVILSDGTEGFVPVWV